MFFGSNLLQFGKENRKPGLVPIENVKLFNRAQPSTPPTLLFESVNLSNPTLPYQLFGPISRRKKKQFVKKVPPSSLSGASARSPKPLRGRCPTAHPGGARVGRDGPIGPPSCAGLVHVSSPIPWCRGLHTALYLFTTSPRAAGRQNVS